MSTTDWIILVIALLGIIVYGVYKSRTTRNLDGYFLGNRTMPWFLVLLSIMGTQASAITFLSAPGQAYTDGMRFVQYYFGLPLAMVVIAIFFVPVFRRLKVYTAYEYLETRFDGNTRSFIALLFLVGRGLSTGLSIYAPSIILSSLLGWNIYYTNLLMGGLLIIYTMSGGAKAVAYTQQLQLIIIITGMFIAGYVVVHLLPGDMGFGDALREAGKYGKMNIITTGVKDGVFDWKDKYNIWSGLIGGFFLALSYFGTDQSQVGRYLTARDDKESKKGLLINGLVKIPMQFLILLLGILVFTFYQKSSAPVYFNTAFAVQAKESGYAAQLDAVEQKYNTARAAANYTAAQAARKEYVAIVKMALPGRDVKDTDYIFLRFVVDHLPVGLVGLLIAVIILAAWGSIAAALNALASCTMVDFHRRFFQANATEAAEYSASRWYTLGWGIFSIVIAMFAHNIGNSLIEAVNIVGSWFYGVILGVFVLAFWFPRIKGRMVFPAAMLAQAIVIGISLADIVSFLWLIPIGVLLVIGFSFLFQSIGPANADPVSVLPISTENK
jgi:solute:Na+ symporter, SSS family